MKRYINHFFSLKAAGDLIHYFQLGHMSAGKEVTESMGIFRAVIDVFKFNTREPRKVVVIGDGSTPRTAAIFAYMTKWEVVSIDPQLNLDKWETIKERTNPQRLEIRPCKIEQAPVDCHGLPTLIVLPHAHVSISTALQGVYNCASIDVVSLPCCTPIEEKYLTLKMVKEHNLKVFVDENIWSPKRTLYMWENLRNGT